MLLNTGLFNQLEKKFGRVTVTDDGVEMRGIYMPDYDLRTGRPRLKFGIVQWGESYRVNCPFCTDTRHRLYVSHRWARYDTTNGDDNLHLAKCFNEEECLGTREQQKKLHAMVYPLGFYAREMNEGEPVKPVADPFPVIRRIALPPGVPLDQLPENHAAKIYLRNRGFNPNIIAAEYGVIFVEKYVFSQPAILEPRIVVPILLPSVGVDGQGDELKGRLGGWQARLIGPPAYDFSQKYMTATGTRKSHLLYGLDKAMHSSEALVVVEGILDAWKVGTNAVALLGKTISKEQCRLIARYAAKRPVVVLLDSDAGDDAAKVAAAIRASCTTARRKVVVGRCPAGKKDPGECSRAECRAAVLDALRE